MRVIAGTLKKKKLSFKESAGLRPMTDKLKGVIFNVIGQYFDEEATCLDLYCGTGSLGIEALSRGMGKAHFVENGETSLGFLRKNIESCWLEQRSIIFKTDVFNFIRNIKEKYDLIFVDPPFNKGLVNPTMQLLEEKLPLNRGGTIVLQLAKQETLEPLKNFSIVKEKEFTEKSLLFIRLKEDLHE